MTALRRRCGRWKWFDPIYKTDFVLLSCSPDEIKRRFKLNLETPENNVFGRFTGLDDGNGLISIIWLNNRYFDHGVIAHESLHAVHWILSNKGLSLTDSSEEAYTYYLQWLVGQINKRLRK